MAGYFGTELQKRLQANAEAEADFIAATPGACQTGRMMGCDDPDRFGWDRIGEFLERDTAFGFRLVASARMDELCARLKERGCRFDGYDVFLADREHALAACTAIFAKGAPPGFAELEPPARPEDEYTRRIQSLMAACGVVPFSGSLLVGDCGPAKTIVVGDAGSSVGAVAHGYRPHNAHSPYHRHAWGGLVAVAPQHRGLGLGTYVNALMIAGVIRDLGASHVYELASASNIPSRRMIETCGLRHEPDLMCGIATPISAERFTR